MPTKNTTSAVINASYVVNPEKGEIKVVVTNKKETTKTEKTMVAFAKNTRYSIYNNGSGYTGL